MHLEPMKKLFAQLVSKTFEEVIKHFLNIIPEYLLCCYFDILSGGLFGFRDQSKCFKNFIQNTVYLFVMAYLNDLKNNLDHFSLFIPYRSYSFCFYQMSLSASFMPKISLYLDQLTVNFFKKRNV